MAIHACRVVHRDLKPSDIIIASDGPRVIDFGIARALEMTSQTSASVVLGTPGFMSPEQVLAREHGAAGDVFALGSVLTFALTGRGPFGEGHPWAVLNSIVHAEPGLAEVPDETLRGVNAACLAKQPEGRPGLEDLLPWLSDPAPTTRASLPPGVRDLTDRYAAQGTPAAGQDQAVPTRQLARILWKTIDQFIETAEKLEPIRQLSDAHARNVATAFAEASTALAAAAEVNVPGAGSIFDDH